MKRAAVAFVAVTLAAFMVLATNSLVQAQGNRQAQEEVTARSGAAFGGRAQVASYSDGHMPDVQATERISIPYGIAPTLGLRDNGQGVVVNGHGSCTAGETVTVAISVTQSATGAVATGQTEQDCTGEATLQLWSLLATTAGTPLETGEAEACGLATTYDGEMVTDTFDWCRSVTLAWFTYLPAIMYEPGPAPSG